MTTQMSIGQVRVVDPILTRVAQGYTQADLVGRFLFPAVPVALSGGRIIQFGKEGFMKYNTLRAPGTPFKRITFGYQGLPYVLENHGLEVGVPREWMRDASVQPGIQLGTRAVNLTMRVHALELERQQATLVTTAGNLPNSNVLTLSGTSQWDGSAGDPITNIEDGREQVRTLTGAYPNVGIFSPKGWKAFKNNPLVLDRIKYTQRGKVTTEIAADLLEIDNIQIGRAITSDDAGNFSDAWGNNFVMGYTALGEINQEVPTAGYTYTLEGHPMIEPAYWEEGTKSWVYPGAYERAPVITANGGFFLIQNPSGA